VICIDSDATQLMLFDTLLNIKLLISTFDCCSTIIW